MVRFYLALVNAVTIVRRLLRRARKRSPGGSTGGAITERVNTYWCKPRLTFTPAPPTRSSLA